MQRKGCGKIVEQECNKDLSESHYITQPLVTFNLRIRARKTRGGVKVLRGGGGGEAKISITHSPFTLEGREGEEEAIAKNLRDNMRSCLLSPKLGREGRKGTGCAECH